MLALLLLCCAVATATQYSVEVSADGNAILCHGPLPGSSEIEFDVKQNSYNPFCFVGHPEFELEWFVSGERKLQNFGRKKHAKVFRLYSSSGAWMFVNKQSYCELAVTVKQCNFVATPSTSQICATTTTTPTTQTAGCTFNGEINNVCPNSSQVIPVPQFGSVGECCWCEHPLWGVGPPALCLATPTPTQTPTPIPDTSSSSSSQVVSPTPTTSPKQSVVTSATPTLSSSPSPSQLPTVAVHQNISCIDLDCEISFGKDGSPCGCNADCENTVCCRDYKMCNANLRCQRHGHCMAFEFCSFPHTRCWDCDTSLCSETTSIDGSCAVCFDQPAEMPLHWPAWHVVVVGLAFVAVLGMLCAAVWLAVRKFRKMTSRIRVVGRCPPVEFHQYFYGWQKLLYTFIHEPIMLTEQSTINRFLRADVLQNEHIVAQAMCLCKVVNYFRENNLVAPVGLIEGVLNNRKALSPAVKFALDVANAIYDNNDTGCGVAEVLLQARRNDVEHANMLDPANPFSRLDTIRSHVDYGNRGYILKLMAFEHERLRINSHFVHVQVGGNARLNAGAFVFVAGLNAKLQDMRCPAHPWMPRTILLPGKDVIAFWETSSEAVPLKADIQITANSMELTLASWCGIAVVYLLLGMHDPKLDCAHQNPDGRVHLEGIGDCLFQNTRNSPFTKRRLFREIGVGRARRLRETVYNAIHELRKQREFIGVLASVSFGDEDQVKFILSQLDNDDALHHLLDGGSTAKTLIQCFWVSALIGCAIAASVVLLMHVY